MNRYGTPHEFMPDDLSEHALVLAFDFEDDHEVTPAALAARNASRLLDLHAAGIDCLDQDPAAIDWETLEARANRAGHDTYNSDTRWELYAGSITCSDDCTEECSPRPSRVRVSADMADPHGIARPSRVDRARAWLADMADYLDRIDSDSDDVDTDALETLEDALRVLEAADTLEPCEHGHQECSTEPRGRCTNEAADLADRCEDCREADVTEYGCPFALHVGERLCLDCCGCPEHVEESHDQNVTTPATAPDQETPGEARAYRVTFTLGNTYETTVNARTAAEAAALIEGLDEDDADEIEVSREVLAAQPVHYCDACGEEMTTGDEATCGDCVRYLTRTTDQDGQP
jgi:hypothetical protein